MSSVPAKWPRKPDRCPYCYRVPVALVPPRGARRFAVWTCLEHISRPRAWHR